MGEMKPVLGEPKDIVRRGYDECAPRYLQGHEDEPPDALLQLIDLLPEGASVLDIGCGAGRPVSTTLARHAVVTGVDISGAQVAAARSALPKSATVIHGDIMAVDFAPRSFDRPQPPQLSRSPDPSGQWSMTRPAPS